MFLSVAAGQEVHLLPPFFGSRASPNWKNLNEMDSFLNKQHPLKLNQDQTNSLNRPIAPS